MSLGTPLDLRIAQPSFVTFHFDRLASLVPVNPSCRLDCTHIRAIPPMPRVRLCAHMTQPSLPSVSQIQLQRTPIETSQTPPFLHALSRSALLPFFGSPSALYTYHLPFPPPLAPRPPRAASRLPHALSPCLPLPIIKGIPTPVHLPTVFCCNISPNLDEARGRKRV